MKFVWQDVSIWDEVKLLSAISLLHLDVVVAQPIFSCNLITLWEMVDSLELIQTLIQVAFA